MPEGDTNLGGDGQERQLVQKLKKHRTEKERKLKV
jgi:hypothetical protein